ncbi:carbonyl reductase [NADPH] 2-like [Bufo bufo]|uniref:carbonyl reductase [NADPH] 2-like n=1 Tax=Bufo bufo TaxID=8384 RepID=UPI001ABE18B9|nr:carbonyl reductase [NADPH] 2-like [Bufo bufo]
MCPGVQTVCVDLVDWPATEAALSSVGPVDLLVNNAGIAEQQSFLEMTQDSFDRHIAVNKRAIIPVSQIVARQIIARGGSGSIVNVSSQISQSPLKNTRAYKVDDVTNSILFLLSDKSAMITGSRLNVDGGYLIS